MVIVLQHVACETLGTIADVLAERRVEARYIRTFAGEPVPATMAGATGLIVMGGPMGVYETDRYPFLADEIRLIQQAIDAGKPVLGVCLGSQLIAAALGAHVHPGPQKEIGWYEVTLSAAGSTDAVFGGAPRTFTAFVWHGDVFDLPQGAVSLASTALTECQAFRYGTNVYGILFHMEVTETVIDGMLTTFTDELRNAHIDDAPIRHAVAAHLPPLRRVGARVFDRWADLLGAGTR
jgi:GMP synthase (glutamine-hydrolysing)